MISKIGEQIDDIVECGLNEMIKDVQQILGITEDDYARQHFSDGKLKNMIMLALMDYMSQEMTFQMDALIEKLEQTK